jgi:polygalacturonase
MIPGKLSFHHRLAKVALTAGCVGASSSSLYASSGCDPRAYGATGDGETKDTVAIQMAIDACARLGGGTVTLAAGTYLSSPIVLKSNITLHLDKGATLLGSSNHEDYPAKTEFHLPDLQPLVSATDSINVAITGDGVIDGAGESWWLEARSIKDHGILGNGHPRPKLIVFDHCKHVVVEGITVQNSPMWHVVPYYSDDVTIRNIRVLAPPDSPNTDAIDPFSSSHVRIGHVYADVGDDDIAIKSAPSTLRDRTIRARILSLPIARSYMDTAFQLEARLRGVPGTFVLSAYTSRAPTTGSGSRRIETAATM